MRARQKRGTSGSDNVVIVNPDYSRDMGYTMVTDQARPKAQDGRLYNHKQGAKGASARRPTKKRSSERSADVAKPTMTPTSPKAEYSQRSTGTPRQAGLLELQQRDSRYPGLLLQPASRPISQEQLATEVKSIYAGLGMVEQKCAHVDRQQAKLSEEALKKMSPDHWQALIALHRTLLHEHHDFFLASQHPSASPALRRLAGKYTMPARMWKHGIHDFLEILRRGLPHTFEYMLAFIYLAYQMMALLYETVPAFEDTWIECLGDLGRYRMAVEDDDIRDQEAWANVSRSWYTTASDRNPRVGRLYHHLAILARSNALHMLYYYGRSLHSWEPFPAARDSVKTLFDHVTGKRTSNMPTPIPIDASFIKAHAYAFEKDSSSKFEASSNEYILQLDSHIGRVTAKWREQGVYTAVANITSWFDYGANMNIIRQLYLLRAEQRKDPTFVVEIPRTDVSAQETRENLQKPQVPESEISTKLDALRSDTTFSRAIRLTNNTFSLVLRRIGDKNVLPHVCVMLSFLSTFASVEYVAHFIDPSPWTEIATFLNTLIKIEKQQNQDADVNATICQPVFPSEGDQQREDELPLPEDHMIRGLIWAEEYIPAKWLERERDKEDRYLELASTARGRVERVLRLGYQLATHNRWISYDEDKLAFARVSVQ
ncbi:hypothetical protein B5807_07842 [Epicoccum nigrum]|uniref:DNA/RNA-binding domain-containing protein n=1 Tax=Epicoccum nigrum TaxID=105696 RepID=A0A1Y2LWF4_EPING|nr:hypothetical protein B5807_07842 [Epicoccum nigrum]